MTDRSESESTCQKTLQPIGGSAMAAAGRSIMNFEEERSARKCEPGQNRHPRCTRVGLNDVWPEPPKKGGDANNHS